MSVFPKEFSALLSRKGRRLLERGVDAPVGREGRRFLTLGGVLEPRRAGACLALLERGFDGLLSRMDEEIPPQSIWGMTENYSEQLPKAVRVWTALLENRRAKAYRRAEELGLVAMLRSDSFLRFAEVLGDRPLRKRWGIQVLCYGQGDYSGPHNDHHPEDEEARDGYLDVHLTFANAGVSRQLLVYEKRGHLSEVASVKTVGGVTAYRLPFWHYTTPLEGSPSARRWVLLGTFLDGARTK